MAESSSFGAAFGKRLNAQASSYVTRALRNTTIAVTELKYANPQNILSTPPVAEDAFVVAMHLRYYPRYEYFENDRAAPVSALIPGHTIIYDIKRRPIFHLNDPFHSVHYYFPRTALNALADEAERPRIEDLRYSPGQCMDDPIIRKLTEVLLPHFERPAESCRLFIDQIMLAVSHHVIFQYGGMSVKHGAGGGLARWQMQRATEMLASSLVGETTLAELAAECGLSVRHFTRAFRESLGMSPHQWLTRRRIETAKLLLMDPRIKLTDIASSCGFADQGHFTRVFSNYVGESPGVWRRNATQ